MTALLRDLLLANRASLSARRCLARMRGTTLLGAGLLSPCGPCGACALGVAYGRRLLPSGLLRTSCADGARLRISDINRTSGLLAAGYL